MRLCGAGILGSVIALVLSCVLTFIAGLPQASAESDKPLMVAATDDNALLAPMSGTVLALDQCRTAPSPAVC